MQDGIFLLLSNYAITIGPPPLQPNAEWLVEPQRLSWEILDTFKDAANEVCGLAYVLVYTISTCTDCINNYTVKSETAL